MYILYNTSSQLKNGTSSLQVLVLAIVGVVLISSFSPFSQHKFTVTAFSPNSSSQSPHIGVRPELSRESHAYYTAEDVDIEIRLASEVKGLGVFATSDIPCGTLLGNYTGEVMTISQVRTRFWGKGECDKDDISWGKSRIERGQGVTGHYLFELPNGSFVDAEDADVSSWCRFMNHAEQSSEDCNVKAFIQAEIGGEIMPFPLMYAIEDIQKGDELCWDYGGKFF